MRIKLYSILVYNLLFTQAPIPVCLDGTIIDSSTILVTTYYCGYVVVLRKAKRGAVDRRLRRYYLIVRLLPYVFARCLSFFGFDIVRYGAPYDGKIPV